MRPCFPSDLKISTWNQKLFHRKRVRERISESCHVRKDKQAIIHGSDPAWMMPAYHQILFDGNLVTLVMRGFKTAIFPFSLILAFSLIHCSNISFLLSFLLSTENMIDRRKNKNVESKKAPHKNINYFIIIRYSIVDCASSYTITSSLYNVVPPVDPPCAHVQ